MQIFIRMSRSKNSLKVGNYMMGEGGEVASRLVDKRYGFWFVGNSDLTLKTEKSS